MVWMKEKSKLIELPHVDIVKVKSKLKIYIFMLNGQYIEMEKKVLLDVEYKGNEKAACFWILSAGIVDLVFGIDLVKESEKRGLILKRSTGELIYETPNLHSSLENRWVVSPNEESTNYLFELKDIKKSDGDEYHAYIVGENTTITCIVPVLVYDTNPVFEIFPNDTIYENVTMNFTCTMEVTGALSVQILYLKNGVRFHISHRSFIKYHDKLVDVGYIVAKPDIDNYNYSCRVSLFYDNHKNITLDSKRKPLRIFYSVRDIRTIPEQKPYSGPLRVDVGKSIECVASGNPLPNYEWRKLNSTMVVANSANLVVEKSWAGKNNFYECTAMNKIDGVTAKITKTVHFIGGGTLIKSDVAMIFFISILSFSLNLV
ncbi:DgyrCDS14555 [Dimorphilus gyrociliatus]|uniref:DgyrCDS14555 n=1 Tax=Dimorphilus gyrociliatus TaxID=2664684 RepID=A0A7I8WE06_9ANNE|nr:DgyrCDS14555 [Dimorphilus gyrociliatus]